MKSEHKIYNEFCKIMKFPKDIDEKDEKMVKNSWSYFFYHKDIRLKELGEEIKKSFLDIINKIKIWTN